MPLLPAVRREAEAQATHLRHSFDPESLDIPHLILRQQTSQRQLTIVRKHGAMKQSRLETIHFDLDLTLRPGCAPLPHPP